MAKQRTKKVHQRGVFIMNENTFNKANSAVKCFEEQSRFGFETAMRSEPLALTHSQKQRPMSWKLISNSV